MVAFFRKHWQLAAILTLVIYQMIAIAQGLVLFTVGNFFLLGGDTLFITTHASIMLIYKIWQKLRAWKHNLRTMWIVRGNLIKALESVIPVSEHSKMQKIAKRYITIERFLYDLLQEVSGYSESLLPDAVMRIFGGSLPSVSIIAPIFDLKNHEVEMMMRSIHNQVYRNIRFCYLIVNDPTDIAMVDFLKKLVIEQYSGPEVRTQFLVQVEGQPGKRNAQYTGFLMSRHRDDKSKYIINMDGDGFAHKYTVAASITRMEDDPGLGLLTGDVRISNWKFNLLTLVTGIRYHVAFWDERAGQKPMICGSGPWLVMRAEALFPILEEWKNYKVLGKVEANFGDDRHLTQEIMKNWRTEVDVDSVVWTDCPTQIKAYRRQQTRWKKSALIYNGKMYVEGLWQRLDLFTRFSLAYLNFYPFTVIFAIGFVLYRTIRAIDYQAINTLLGYFAPHLLALIFGSYLLLKILIFISAKAQGSFAHYCKLAAVFTQLFSCVFVGAFAHKALITFDPVGLQAAADILTPYLLSVIFVNLVFQSSSGLLLFHDWRFLLSPLYSPLWFWVQIPANFVAPVTILDQGWGTRKERLPQGQIKS